MYNKIFTKILDSSIWLESHPTRIVWLTFIAAMDETGFCAFASVANVARRAIVSDTEAEEAIRCLTSPDVNSSDPENEGRRLERVQGGWIVLNAEKYRAIVSRANQQEKTRARVAKYRQNQKSLDLSDSESESNQKHIHKESVTEALQPVTTGVSVEHRIYALYPRKQAKVAALKAIRNTLKIKSADFLFEAVGAYAKAVSQWPISDRKFIPYGATWFNAGAYDDDRETWKRQSFSSPNHPTAPAARIGKDV